MNRKHQLKKWFKKLEDFYFLHIRKYIKIQKYNLLHICFSVSLKQFRLFQAKFNML